MSWGESNDPQNDTENPESANNFRVHLEHLNVKGEKLGLSKHLARRRAWPEQASSASKGLA